MIRSELKYLIGAKIVNLKSRFFGGKTGPMATVRDFGVVRPVATVRIRVEPYPEPTGEFGPVAITSYLLYHHAHIRLYSSLQCKRGERTY
jgi:hypothetical protein